MIRSNDLKFWELLPKVGQLGSVGVVCGLVGLLAINQLKHWCLYRFTLPLVTAVFPAIGNGLYKKLAEQLSS